MNFVDTHCHVFLEEFDEDREEVVARAASNGVTRLVLPNVDCSTIERLRASCRDFPGTCFPVIGLHPSSVNEHYQDELSTIRRELETGEYLGVGEIGMDLYWDKTYRTEQETAFSTQLRWAKELDLPVIIHVRQAFPETLETITREGIKGLRGVFHCFSGGIEEAQKVVGMGFMLGIGGVATFKNGGIGEVVSQVGLEHILLETDAPYLAPTPHRGKRNEPSFLPLVAARIAEIKGISVEEVAKVTTRNAGRLFGIQA